MGVGAREEYIITPTKTARKEGGIKEKKTALANSLL